MASSAIPGCAATVVPSDGFAHDTSVERTHIDASADRVDESIEADAGATSSDATPDGSSLDVGPPGTLCRTDLPTVDTVSTVSFAQFDGPGVFAVDGYFMHPGGVFHTNVRDFGDCSTFENVDVTWADGSPLSLQLVGQVLSIPFASGRNFVQGNAQLATTGDPLRFVGTSATFGGFSIDLRLPGAVMVTADQPLILGSAPVTAWAISRPVEFQWPPQSGTIELLLGRPGVAGATWLSCRFDANAGHGQITSAALVALGTGVSDLFRGFVYAACENEVEIAGQRLLGTAYHAPNGLFMFNVRFAP